MVERRKFVPRIGEADRLLSHQTAVDGNGFDVRSGDSAGIMDKSVMALRKDPSTEKSDTRKV